MVRVRFDAYARVFHAAGFRRGEDHSEVGWSEAAAPNGRVMHGAGRVGLDYRWDSDVINPLPAPPGSGIS